jgi:hypothetical protein
MTDPTNDAEQVADSPDYNRIAEALADALSGEWWIESEVDAVGRAYHGDPRTTDPKEVVGVEIRTDYEAPFSVSSSLWSDQKGMHDLGEFAKCETLEEAVETAVEMAQDLPTDSEGES